MVDAFSLSLVQCTATVEFWILENCSRIFYDIFNKELKIGCNSDCCILFLKYVHRFCVLPNLENEIHFPHCVNKVSKSPNYNANQVCQH